MTKLSFRRLSAILPRRRSFLAGGVAFVLLAAFAALPAFAVHDVGVFELDGNATNQAVAGDDWDNVYCEETGLPAGCSDTSASGGATATSFKNDGARGNTIFTGGGSKDDLNINPPPGPGQGWAWKNGGGLPDKDNLQDAFAARYVCDTTDGCTGTDGDVYLFFGADRFDNSGDAQMGFWFLQGDVTNEAGGTFGPDTHVIGDLLILSDFTGGGGDTHIRIFQWDPTDPAAINGTLVPLGGSETTSATCGSAAGDDFCGIVNGTGGVDSPWPFLDKSGNTDFAQGELYEGGVNLSFFPEFTGTCFASLVSETRSSSSVDATLKDFVADNFEACEATINTVPSAGSGGTVNINTQVTDTATVTGEGGGTPTGSVIFHICSPSQLTNNLCPTDGSLVGSATGVPLVPVNATTATATSDPFTVNAVGRWCWRGDYVPAPGSVYGPVSDSDASECFNVRDVSATTTAQNWLPNDSATVTTTGGSPVSGTVVFTLYSSGDCTGTVLGTFTDNSAPFTTNNTTVVTSDTTISWRAVFTSSDPNAVVGSTSRCEKSVLTINNDSSA
jgi:hypothetical protein